MKKHIIYFALALLLSACEGSSKIYFESPQPDGKRDLTAFRKSFVGTFEKSERDDPYFLSLTRLHVQPERVVREMSWYFQAPREALARDKEFDFDVYNDSLWHEEIKDIDPPGDLRLTVDSVNFTWSNNDTLFEFSEKTRLCYYRKHHFLNYQEEDQSWRITMLAREHDTLWVRKLTVPDDTAAMRNLLSLREIRDEDDLIIQYILDPSRRQLRKFLRLEGVVEEEGFVRSMRYTD